MRKILILLMAIVAFSATSPAFATSPRNASGAHQKNGRNIMELPLFERAVLIIKKFETLHKPKHWPYVGYGHGVQPGEPYRRGVQLTETQADALLRKDLRKFCALYSQYGKDSVLLGALAYNCGPGVVNRSSVLKKLKVGNRDIFKAYTAHCRYKGKFHKQLYQRRVMEFMLLFERACPAR